MNWKISENSISLLDAQENMLAEVTFPSYQEGVVEINHTFVDDSLRGQGIAGQLMERAAAQIEKNGKKLVPTCSYAVRWFEKHPEYDHLIFREEK